jgi:predicted AAA+ superfamily ATPase
MIGRIEEIAVLNDLLSNDKAEMLAVYGRRRVGKTYLINQAYKSRISFGFTGTQNASVSNQLFKFSEKLKESFDNLGTMPLPKTWFEAFGQLKKALSFTEQKQVVFFDELPWIASSKSNFLEELGYWWNDWASHQNIVVVVCGSAASWMLNKIINNKGGLHNRVTHKINLKPFTLAESKIFLESLNVFWDDYQIIQFYMSVGGVPTYLQEAKQGESAMQAIERMFFTKDGLLRNEFANLYEALFEKHQNHILIIKTLADKWAGMSRQEIILKSKFNDGGGLTKVLDELEASSFIMKVPTFGTKQKKFTYRLIDEYSLFYLKFIDGKTLTGKYSWQQQAMEEKYKIWAGYAFENICIKHQESIKMALGINGIYTEISSYSHKANDEMEGFQIDMLIDRADRAINLCEVKFYNDDFLMTEAYTQQLRQRRERFRVLTKTKKMLFNTIITTYGLKHSKGSLAQIDQVITMDKLFLMNRFE